MRSRYRSQPNLRRTGSRSGLLPFGLFAAAAVFFVSMLISRQSEAPSQVQPPAPPPVARAAAPKAAEPPARQAATALIAPPPAQAAPEPPSVALAEVPSSFGQAAAPAVTMEKSAPVRAEPKALPEPAPRPARAARPAPDRVETWRQERERYADALDDYDARERAAGYRWAERYDVTSARYCRETADRTPAFMQGCLGYARGE